MNKSFTKVATLGTLVFTCVFFPHTAQAVNWPGISFSSDKSVVQNGGTVTLTWDSTGADICTGVGFSTGGADSGSVVVTPPSNTTTFYKITCKQSGTSHTGAPTSVSVKALANPAAQVVFGVSPAATTAGQSSTITWTSSYAASCTGTGFSTGSATSGSLVVNPIVTTTYSISCTGPGGGSGTFSKTVTVTPAVSISANPNPITQGSNSLLTWSSTGAVSCSGGGFNTGGLTSGSVNLVNPPLGPNLYSINCVSADGHSAFPNTTLQVNPPPTLNGSCSVSPTSTITGNSVNWTASAAGGVPPYTYSWNGNGLFGRTSVSEFISYATAGIYGAGITVTDSANIPQPPYQRIHTPSQSCSGSFQGTYYLQVTEDADSGTYNAWRDDALPAGAGALSSGSPAAFAASPKNYCVQEFVRTNCPKNNVPVCTNDVIVKLYNTSGTMSNSGGSATNGQGDTSSYGYATETYIDGSAGSGNTSVTNTCSNSVTVTAALPNLTATIGSPVGTTVGTPTSFTGTVRNIGAGSTGVPGTYDDYIRFYTDAAATNPAYVDGPTPWTYAGRGGPLAASATQARSGSYTFSVPGTYYYRLCTDWNTEITETSDGDNCSTTAAVTVTAVALPNLTAVTSPTIVNTTVGTPIAYTGTTQNIGSVGTGGTFEDAMIIYKSDMVTWQTWTTIPGNPALPGNTSAARTFPAISINTPGTYYYRMCADTGPSSGWMGSINEGANENDNCGAFTQINVSAALPDLTALPGPQVTMVDNTSHTFTGTVVNGPSAGTGISFPVMLQICDAGCAMYNDTNYFVTNAALAANGSSAVSINRPWTGGAGTFFYRICADNNSAWVGSVTESNENNNCSTWNDLQVSASAPDTTCSADKTNANIGDTVTYTVTALGTAVGPFSWKDSDGVTSTGSTWARTYTTLSSGPGTYIMQVKASNTSYKACTVPVVVAANYCSTPPASISITASPSRVKSGGSTYLTWDASNLQGDTPVCDVTSSDLRLNQLVTSGGLPMCAIPTGNSSQNGLTIPVKYTITCHDSVFSNFAVASTTVNIIPKYNEF